MNRETTIFLEKKLSLALMEAVQDPNKWADALDVIMEITGAKGAIITLRDKSSCQIVNDLALEQTYHSPLVRGFSTEEIVYYLTNLRAIDPWAEYQKSYYPFQPVQMSKVCPMDSVPDQRFFNWLKGVGFEDTIVFELDRMAGHWTAINLFFDSAGSTAVKRALDFCFENYDLLRNAWATSQTLSRTQQSNAALLTGAIGVDCPAAVVGPNGELLESNEKFNTVLRSGVIRLSGSKRKLSFAHCATVVGLEKWAQHDFLRHDAETAHQVILAAPLDPDPLFAGKREKHWVLTLSQALQSNQATANMAHLSALTRQERSLYKEIASGKSVEQAGIAINLKRTRSFEVWLSVKDKLGLKSAHQLRH